MRRLEAMIDRQTQERGIDPMPLEPETLLRRVRALDWSGEYLGHALISAYYRDEPFTDGLFKLINLDAEGFRLFHQILHIRHVSGWRDNVLYALVQEIKTILAKRNDDKAAYRDITGALE
jgi:hypothetical protein